jgi:hypothetical protein
MAPMWFSLDIPSPLSPIEGLRAAVADLESIPDQDHAQLRDALTQVRRSLAGREAEQASALYNAVPIRPGMIPPAGSPTAPKQRVPPASFHQGIASLGPDEVARAWTVALILAAQTSRRTCTGTRADSGDDPNQRPGHRCGIQDGPIVRDGTGRMVPMSCLRRREPVPHHAAAAA